MEDDFITELSYPEPDDGCASVPSTAGQRGKERFSKADPDAHPLYGSIEVEALLSLNNTIITGNESTRLKSPTGASGESCIPITAPLPLSYAVRGKGAYSSILSVGDTDDDSDEPQEDTTTTVVDIYSDAPRGVLRGDMLPFGIPIPIITTNLTTENYTQNCGKKKTNSPTFYSEQNQEGDNDVRPITPSTLMALTEPCLMSWCYKLDLMDDDELTPTTASAFSAPPPPPVQPSSYYIIEPDMVNRTSAGVDDSDMMYTHIQYESARPRNDWGY